MHVQDSQDCPHPHDSGLLVSKHLALSVTRRRHPTAYDIHRGSRNKTSVHRDLCHGCHEIHLEDVPNLAGASALNCHEQFLLELELASITVDSSDQRHTTSCKTTYQLPSKFTRQIRFLQSLLLKIDAQATSLSHGVCTCEAPHNPKRIVHCKRTQKHC